MYYDVTWYVDNTEVLTGQTVQSNVALLSATQMLAKDKKANSMVCQVDSIILILKKYSVEQLYKNSHFPLTPLEIFFYNRVSCLIKHHF